MGGGRGAPPPPLQLGPQLVAARKQLVQAGSPGVSTPNEAKRSRWRAGGTGHTLSQGHGERPPRAAFWRWA